MPVSAHIHMVCERFKSQPARSHPRAPPPEFQLTDSGRCQAVIEDIGCTKERAGSWLEEQAREEQTQQRGREVTRVYLRYGQWKYLERRAGNGPIRSLSSTVPCPRI